MDRRPKRKGLILIYTDWSHCELFEQEYKAFIRSDIILGKIKDAKEHIHLEEEQAVARLIRFRLAEKDRPFGISHIDPPSAEHQMRERLKNGVAELRKLPKGLSLITGNYLGSCGCIGGKSFSRP